MKQRYTTYRFVSINGFPVGNWRWVAPTEIHHLLSHSSLFFCQMGFHTHVNTNTRMHMHAHTHTCTECRCDLLRILSLNLVDSGSISLHVTVCVCMGGDYERNRNSWVQLIRKAIRLDEMPPGFVPLSGGINDGPSSLLGDECKNSL